MRIAGANVVKRNATKKVKYLLQFPMVLTPGGATEGVEMGEIHGLTSRNPVVYLRIPEVRRRHR
jgi:hypothetical protein